MAGLTQLLDELTAKAQPMQFYYSIESGVTEPAFEVDCVESERFSASTRYTSNPVQSGSDITDHAIDAPLTLSIDFIVSNFPVRLEEVPLSIGAGIIGSLSDSILAKVAVSEAIVKLREAMDPEGYLRSKKAFEKIEELRLKRVPLQIYSRRREYQNMVITSFDVTDTADTQHSLIGSLTFQQIRIVDVSKVTVTPPSSIDDKVKAGAVKSSNIGSKATKTLDAEKSKKASSWLLSLFS